MVSLRGLTSAEKANGRKEIFSRIEQGPFARPSAGQSRISVADERRLEDPTILIHTVPIEHPDEKTMRMDEGGMMMPMMTAHSMVPAPAPQDTGGDNDEEEDEAIPASSETPEPTDSQATLPPSAPPTDINDNGSDATSPPPSTASSATDTPEDTNSQPATEPPSPVPTVIQSESDATSPPPSAPPSTAATPKDTNNEQATEPPSLAPTAIQSSADAMSPPPSTAPSVAASLEDTNEEPATEPPSPAPTVIQSIPVMKVSPSPSIAPSETEYSDQIDHSDVPLPKKADRPAASGRVCSYSGFVQQWTCKTSNGFGAHPIGFSFIFLILFIFGCCTCRRACKPRRDDRGEYRAVADQYDEMLFSDTFDDNYSASFADDRSEGSSISDEQADDWTKGPNIELSEMNSAQKDELTLEEMNG